MVHVVFAAVLAVGVLFSGAAMALSDTLMAAYRGYVEAFQSADYPEAEAQAAKAIELGRAELPAGDPQLAILLSNLAAAKSKTGKPKEAEDLYMEAVALNEAARGEGSPKLITTYRNVGTFFLDHNRYSEANAWYQKALDIAMQAYGAGHEQVKALRSDLELVANARAEADAMLKAKDGM